MLLTSPYKFIDKLYLSFKEDKIDEVYEIKRKGKYKIKYPEGVNSSEVYWDTGEVPFEKEEFKKKIIKHFKDKLVTRLQVKNYLFDALKSQNPPEGGEELEDIIKNFYGMQNYVLIREDEVEEANKFANVKIIDRLGFIEESIADEVFKKIRDERGKRYILNEAKKFIDEAEEFLKYELYQFHNKNCFYDKIKKPDFYLLDSLEGELAEKTRKLKEKIDSLEVVDLWSLGGFIIVEKGKKYWEVKIPDDLKGRFIGKGGENVKSLAKEYGVRIKVV